MQSQPVGWFDTDAYDLHINSPGHPESPRRLHAIRAALVKRGLDARLQRRHPEPIDRALLTSLHTPAHIAAIEAACANSARLDPDTAVVPPSWPAALLAAGAAAEAAQRVVAGELQRAFCSIRPPGHHALIDRAGGFCLFGNAAAAAQAALNTGRVARVAILDWDAHHGNGTQELFWKRGDVFYASMHQYPFYPGTGAADERGVGLGAGKTLNCPLARGDGDTAFFAAWQDAMRPAFEEFGPELLIISAGFDADRRDPLSGLEVTPAGFAKISEAVVRWADRYCQGRVVSVLEGGYSLEALAEDVPLHVEALL